MPTRLLLDTSSLAYRAFFALPTSITGPHGRPVNAVRGYLDMTARLVSERRPGEVVHVLDDDWRPAPRVAAYDGYKSERPQEPADLSWQWALLREVLAAAGQRQAWAPGWEADDAIGTLCEQAGPGAEVDVVTGDRDLLQLVRDGAVRVLFTVKGVRELAVFDEAAVRAKYGVPPDRYPDFATLRGDPSDGLPGVKGIGEKTARDLVGRYPDLEALLVDAERFSRSLPLKLAENLRGARAYVAAMADVVPVRRDVPVEEDPGARDDARLAALAADHGIEAPVARLLEALDALG